MKPVSELLALCQEFVDNHPFEEEGDQGYNFDDGQLFFEEVPEEDILDFFSEMYNILVK